MGNIAFVRVGGVERHGRRWRVRGFGPNGEREDMYFADDEKAKAEAFVVHFRSLKNQRSVGSVLTEYLEHLKRFGGRRRKPVKASSLAIIRSKLVVILGLFDVDTFRRNRGKRVHEHAYHDRPLSALTPATAQRLYTACVESGLSADTHRGYLVAANAFGTWCQARGYLSSNPYAGVLPEGELKKGKAQLTVDEARRFIAAAYADSHVGGLAAAAVLTLGVRSMELLERTVRELDDNGRVLVIPRSKTDAGRRRVAIPPVLRERLTKLAEGLAPDERLFGTMTDGSLLGHVKRICEVADVPTVVTHGLRGTHLTLTMEVETALAGVARSVGHANTKVTRAHYLAAGSEQSARAARMEELLGIAQPSDDSAQLEREIMELQSRLNAVKTRGAHAG